MKKLILLLFITISCQIQAQNYVVPSDYSFYTLDKDSLFLNTGSELGKLTEQIWRCDTTIVQKPILVLLDERTFNKYLRKED